MLLALLLACRPDDEPKPAPEDGTTDPDSAAPADTGVPFPGGFVEPTTSAEVRPRPTAEELAAFLPAAGETFRFPEPWGTEAVRLTDDDTCGGTDCVAAIGYSYWRNTNAHADRDAVSIFLGIDGALALLTVDKATGAVTYGQPTIEGAPISGTGEQVFWSGSNPDRLYVVEPGFTGRMLAVDVAAGTADVVYDATAAFGEDAYVWQPHASDDDRVHSFTLREYGTWATLGCVVYFADTDTFAPYLSTGDFDECQVDRSGRWLLVKENVDGAQGEDNRIVDLESGEETLLLDEDGAGGHSDSGHGYAVAADNWNALPGAVRRWDFPGGDGLLVYHEIAWEAGLGHVSHTNARADAPPEDQHACASNATSGEYARANEIVCFRLDGSLDVLVVAPVMTDIDAPGGGEAYYRYPKGNLDVTGRYFVWTTNLGGDRLDAFLVKVPTRLLYE